MTSRFTTGMPAVRVFVLASAGLLTASVALLAQNNAGSISGVVEDPQGAVIPAAKVTLTNDEQGAGSARTVNTTSDGTFVFTPVLAGKYTVTVEVMGFKKYAVRHHPGRERSSWPARDCPASWRDR